MLGTGEFLERLASADPVPGGGSVAALQAAMAGALLAMVCNLTLGRRKFDEVQGQIEKIREDALRAVGRAEELVDEDVRAYGQVAAALGLPRATDEERAARKALLQESLIAAAGPPAETMRLASHLLTLAERLVSIGNPSAVSDVGTAALAARSAFHAARLNVEINVAGILDRAAAEEIGRDLPRAETIDPLAERIVGRTESIIRGPVG